MKVWAVKIIRVICITINWTFFSKNAFFMHDLVNKNNPKCIFIKSTIILCYILQEKLSHYLNVCKKLRVIL